MYICTQIELLNNCETDQNLGFAYISRDRIG